MHYSSMVVCFEVPIVEIVVSIILISADVMLSVVTIHDQSRFALIRKLIFYFEKLENIFQNNYCHALLPKECETNCQLTDIFTGTILHLRIILLIFSA